MTVTLLGLPPELRAQIYREVYARLRLYVAFSVTASNDQASSETLQVRADPPSAKAFLCLSKTTYTESIHLFYSLAVILVTGYGRYDHRLRCWLRVLARLTYLRKHVTHVAFSSGFDSTDASCFPEIHINRLTAFELEPLPGHYVPSTLTPPNWTYYDVSLLQNLRKVTLYLGRPRCGKIWIYHSNIHQFAHLAKGLTVVGRQSGRYVRAYSRAMDRYGSEVPRRLLVEVRWCLRRMQALEPMPSLLPEHQFNKICSFTFDPNYDVVLTDKIRQDEDEHRGCIFCEGAGSQSLGLPLRQSEDA